MGKKVVLHVHKGFVFSYPHTGEVGSTQAGRERPFAAGVHELDLSNDDDAAVIGHKWIQAGADGRIDIGGSRKASVAANLPPPPAPAPKPNKPGETLGLIGDEEDEDEEEDEDDAALAAAAAAAKAATAADAGKKAAPPIPPPPSKAAGK